MIYRAFCEICERELRQNVEMKRSECDACCVGYPAVEVSPPDLVELFPEISNKFDHSLIYGTLPNLGDYPMRYRADKTFEEMIVAVKQDWEKTPTMDQLSLPPVEAAGTEALRFNEGKAPFANLPMDLLDGAARVMAYGEKKYGRSNFRKGYKDLFSPLSSAMRHLTELQKAIEMEDKDNGKGHLIDAESGHAHIHHLITSLLLLLHSMRMQGYKEEESSKKTLSNSKRCEV